MTAHSPGPWEQRKNGTIVDADGDEVVGMDVGWEGGDETVRIRNPADERLIIAAPNLLQAVKDQTRLLHKLVTEMQPDRPGWSEWGPATELLARVQGLLNQIEPEETR